jgi:hypothetical protein
MRFIGLILVVVSIVVASGVNASAIASSWRRPGG